MAARFQRVSWKYDAIAYAAPYSADTNPTPHQHADTAPAHAQEDGAAATPDGGTAAPTPAP